VAKNQNLRKFSPTYRWVCHKCEHVNEPFTNSCARCDFSAIASGWEIAKSKGEPYSKPAFDGSLPEVLGLLLMLLPW
jgi:hypothetical protein